MSNRTIRVNELIQRELNGILRQKYQGEAVAITVTEVRVAPDLRDARVFVAIMGGADEEEKKMRWLRRKARDIREEIADRIVLKFLPRMTYVLDKSGIRSGAVLRILDQLEGPAPSGPALGEGRHGGRPSSGSTGASEAV